MTVSPTPLPAIGVPCWRDVVSPSTGATVLSLESTSHPEDPMVELGGIPSRLSPRGGQGA